MTSPEAQPETEFDSEQAQRFYSRLRGRVTAWFARKGPAAGKVGDILIVLPDLFALVLRLMRDPRIGGRTKLELAAVTAYVVSPIDLVPDFLFPIGFADDAVALALVLSRVAQLLGEAGDAVLEEHWEGESAALRTITNVMNAADAVLNKRILGRLGRRFGAQ
ncbi:MAG: YkvA family protein [Anaerolineae bacterium]|jgi:uncharacterized membrane protein YkvA (DUF1232 family)|nr:YkvA family protein [Anaerolineae bacterium]